MSKRRRRRSLPPHPRYDFPGLSDLTLALLALVIIALVGITLAGTDTAQTMAHGTVAVQEAQP